MTNYEDIKKTSEQTPNQYIVFGRVYETPNLSILPNVINQELTRVISPTAPNKTYYVDDGQYTIRILSKTVNNQIMFEYSLKFNDISKKVIIPDKNQSYEDYLSAFKYYIISAVIVLCALLIFLFPILKSFT